MLCLQSHPLIPSLLPSCCSCPSGLEQVLCPPVALLVQVPVLQSLGPLLKPYYSLRLPHSLRQCSLRWGLVHNLPIHLTEPWMSPWTVTPLPVWKALLQTHSCSMKELIPGLLALIFPIVYSGIHCICRKPYWLSQLSWMWYRSPACEASELPVYFQGAQEQGAV